MVPESEADFAFSPFQGDSWCANSSFVPGLSRIARLGVDIGSWKEMRCENEQFFKKRKVKLVLQAAENVLEQKNWNGLNEYITFKMEVEKWPFCLEQIATTFLY